MYVRTVYVYTYMYVCEMPLPKNLPRSAKASPPSTSAGKRGVLANRYCVEHKLGSGAFGSAYLVTDLKTVNNER